MDIEPRYSIPKGSKAFAMTPLMGQANVNIIPATDTSELLPQDGTGGIVGTVTGPLDQVIDPKMMDVLEATVKQIGTLADALTPAAKAVTTLLERRTVEEIDKPTTAPEKVTANLSTAVERLHKVLKHFDTVLGDPAVQSNVKDTLANFKAASEEARQAAAGLKAFGEQAQQAAAGAKGLIGKVDATMDTTHKYVNELGQRLVVSAEQISKLLTYLNSAGRDIAEGQGTVGMLLRDPKFYDELMLTVQRLGNAASELQVLVKQWQNQGLLGMAR